MLNEWISLAVAVAALPLPPVADIDASQFPGIVVREVPGAMVSRFYAHYVDEDDCEWGWGDSPQDAVKALRSLRAAPEDRPYVDADEPDHNSYRYE